MKDIKIIFAAMMVFVLILWSCIATVLYLGISQIDNNGGLKIVIERVWNGKDK